MALRLDDLVVGGEIDNTRKYAVNGWIQLRDREHPIHLNLTGNCDPDLLGRHIHFEARGLGQTSHADPTTDEPQLPKLAGEQIGPTGSMTAARQVKVSDCSPEELDERCEKGEPPPFEWKRCLYLEWFSQNGRVVIELVDPIVEFVEGQTPAADPPDEEPEATPSGLGITAIHLDEDGNADISSETLSTESEEEEADDPYGLFPDHLQQELDNQTWEVERGLQDEDDVPEAVRELELMDRLIEEGPGEPIRTIFERTLKLPPPEQLEDEQVEPTLKTLLAEMALFGIALDICEHFTPRDAYRLLLEEICQNETAYPELRQTQWVQHFMTSEFCPECEAQMEREFEEYQRRRKENPPDETSGDEEIPF